MKRSFFKKTSLSRIIWLYVLLLTSAVVLLIFWVLYVVDSYQTINDFVTRYGGGSGSYYHWIVLAIGSTLLVSMIVGLSLQLAQNISEYRYNRKQEEFISNITHELKSPLAAIRLHAETLIQNGLTADEQRRFANHILEQSKRMTELVENVLEISRLRSHVNKLPLEKIDLYGFLTRYCDESRLRLQSQGHSFESDIQTKACIWANQLALARILDNLLDNAMKATKPNERLGLTCHDLNGHVELEIWDHGIGIPKKELSNIFKRFYQIGPEIRTRRKGTGLGLAIVSELVKELKGTIRVEQQTEHTGSRFIITFANSLAKKE